MPSKTVLMKRHLQSLGFEFEQVTTGGHELTYWRCDHDELEFTKSCPWLGNLIWLVAREFGVENDV